MDRHSTEFYFSIWEIGRKRKCFFENQGDDRRWGIPRREFKREISSRFQSQRSIDEENINFFIGKDRFCRGGANYRKKCEGQRGSDGNEDVRTRLVRCQTLTNATALTVNAIQFVFPSLLASVSRNWLRTPRLDLFPLIYIYIYIWSSCSSYSFALGPVCSPLRQPSRREGFIETPVYLDISALFSANLAWEESTFQRLKGGW